MNADLLVRRRKAEVIFRSHFLALAFGLVGAPPPHEIPGDSQAEPIKRLLSLDEGPAPEGITAEHFSAARDAAVGQVNTFARELVSSLQFYQSQPGSLGIGEIIITGGTAHLGLPVS